MENWNEEQQKFIQKLSRMQDVFRDIRDKDKRCEVIQYAERDDFETLAKKCGALLEKLKKHEFTVAVVGLEKAGKSTLGNALLKRALLPEYTERCTYTTTEIRAGSKDAATVHFYTKDKFSDDFRAMLASTNYPSETELDTMDIDAFEKYWQTVKSDNPALFQQHNGTTVADIKAIVEGKGVIQYLTGKEPKTLNLSDKDDSKDLKRYITGIDGKQNGHAVRTAEPYAVEKVVIQSTNLVDMEHIVLYDVPGFDSPTELHKKQTLEMLKQADAIILVTNVGDRPNLTGTQLDMLQKGRDADDVSLSDKVFVFGNKLDMAGNAERAGDNAKALAEETIRKYGIAKDGRVVCGSAKAYLESQGVQTDDEEERGALNVSATLREWKLPDGIDNLKDKMNEYYRNDRFEVLRQRAEKIIGETERFLGDILKRYESQDTDEFEDGGKQLLQAKDAMDKFVLRAREISQEYRKQLNEELPFSALIRDNITAIFPPETEDSPRVRDVENSGIGGTGYALSRVDAILREKLQLEFQKNIVEKTANATQEKEREIYQRLAEELLQSLGMKPDSSYREELERSAKELFAGLLIQNGEHCWFNPLVERYVTGLLEVLIKSPFASAERLQKLTGEAEMPDFQSLAIYYEKKEAEVGNSTETGSEQEAKSTSVKPVAAGEEKQFALMAKILAHTDVVLPTAEENEAALQELFTKDGGKLTSQFDVTHLPFGTWAKLLAKQGVRVPDSDLPERLQKELLRVFGDGRWKQMSSLEKNKIVKDAMIVYCSNVIPASLKERLQTLSESVDGVKTKEEMIRVLNADVEILRDITLYAIIPAIGLERAFLSVMSKNVDIIRDRVTGDSGQEVFNRWLKANMRRIREDEFATIDRNKETRQSKKAIAEAIRQVLEKMER